jgi:two-component system response regulator
MSGESKVVLVVEDNPRDEELTLLALEEIRPDKEIVIARDGAQALDYLFGAGAHAGRDTRNQPELIFLDLKLPRIDGLEVLARLRASERTSLLPVVMLTSSDDDRDLVHSYGLHANSYIRKPVDFVQFVHAIRQVAFDWFSQSEARTMSQGRGVPRRVQLVHD